MQPARKMIDHIQTEMKSRMEAKNLGPTDLERRAGLKQSVVRNILNGTSKNPGIESLTAIAKSLGCSLDELIGQEELQNIKRNKSDSPKSKEIVTWNAELYQDCTAKVEQHLQTKKRKPSGEQILFFIKEAYLYALKGKETQADIKFIEWLIDSYI
jgi:transcriptional regulator with XRE-family HTH domain